MNISKNLQKQFYEIQMPELIRQLTKLVQVLEKQNQINEKKFLLEKKKIMQQKLENIKNNEDTKKEILIIDNENKCKNCKCKKLIND